MTDLFSLFVNRSSVDKRTIEARLENYSLRTDDEPHLEHSLWFSNTVSRCNDLE